MGQAVLRDRRNPFRSETSAETQTHARVCLAADRKGMGLIFPNPDTEIGPSGPSAVTQPNSETSTEDPGKSYLFSVTVRVPGIGSSGDRDANLVKAPRLLRCPVRLCWHLKIRGR
ncbi:hypothetical protein JTE90_016095 [Oedothorax gibbosus]|uniref:Uncharacterized protein n=1 Tax=Oedothorax gibbosus TaxID=931172 RepID=A0AAV6TSH0_9ARAC|nr:hypothetical protein JTE90_016095 [Oedothorax gibbosus]